MGVPDSDRKALGRAVLFFVKRCTMSSAIANTFDEGVAVADKVPLRTTEPDVGDFIAALTFGRRRHHSVNLSDP